MEGPACLQCGQALEQDFGIVTCSGCGALLIVGMDGEVRFAQDESAAELAPEAAAESLEFQSTNEYESSDGVVSESPSEPDFASDSPVEALISTDEENFVAEGADVDLGNSDFQSFDSPVQEPSAPSSLSEPGFADVESFGAQDVDAGPLQYDLVLSGIDRQESRAEVMRVLADPRLFLSVKDLAPVNGTILIASLSAARASLIASQVQHLSIQINWKQKTYEN